MARPHKPHRPVLSPLLIAGLLAWLLCPRAFATQAFLESAGLIEQLQSRFAE